MASEDRLLTYYFLLYTNSVILNRGIIHELLNELRKRDKCKTCRAFYCFFFNNFIKSNNTESRMIHSVDHTVPIFFLNMFFWHEKKLDCGIYEQHYYVGHFKTSPDTRFPTMWYV